MEDMKPLWNLSEAFKELAATIDSQTADMKLAPFCCACSLIVPLIGSMGIAFKFAEVHYAARVNDLEEASKSFETLQALVDGDLEARTVRNPGSPTQNLLRVKRALELVRIMFEEILVTDGNTIRGPVSKAYGQVFAPHHGRAVRKVVAAATYALPTRAQMLKNLNEDEASAKVHLQSYVASSTPVILYIDGLFRSRELFN